MSRFSASKTYALFAAPSNKKLLAELEAVGAEIVLFPPIEVKSWRPPETSAILTTLTDFDWLIFPDIYAVDFFLAELEELNIDFFVLDAVQTCAYGESVADRLRFSQLHADIITNTIKRADVFAALKDFIFDENEFGNLRFLVLKEKTAPVGVTEDLINSNAKVTELAVYQTEKPAESNLAKLKTLLKGGAVDEFIFTSPFDVLNLSHLFQTENLADVLLETELFATDQATAQALQEFRLK